MSDERYCDNCKQHVVPQRPKVKGIGGCGGFVLAEVAVVLIGAVAIGVGVTNIVDPLGVGHRDRFLLITGVAALVLVTILNVWAVAMKSHCPICHTEKGMR